jgi:hypothetical protein
MAIYKIFPTQDATIYQSYPTLNTGLDEILEASIYLSTYSTTNNPTETNINQEVVVDPPSRFLIQFSSTEINDVITNKISSSQWQSNLRCFVATATGLNSDVVLEIYPVSQSWDMGTGKFNNNPITTNGVSWIWKNYLSGSKWITGSFNPGTTGSYSSSIGGGTWYVTSSLSASTTFGYYADKDININVTNIVGAWYSSSIPNNGFIVKQQTEFIDDINIQPKLKYYSVDTNTIYPPQLEFRWNDYSFNTGSSGLTFISSSQIVATFPNNKGFFEKDSIEKFRLDVRPQYPNRTFQTSSFYIQNYLLPTASYYAVKDLDTNEFVIDFDTTYTKLSADDQGNYFTIYMNGLEPERYYKFLIKTLINGETLVLDDNYYFKVING